MHQDPGSAAGSFAGRPDFIAIHGSRSGTGRSTNAEYDGTRAYARVTDLGWNITVGNDRYSIHMATRQWGYHARATSRRSLSAELAQANRYFAIEDGQVRAFCHWLRASVLAAWPDWVIGPGQLLSHGEIEARGWTGVRDGKDDPFLAGDPRMDELRARILARLDDQSWTV